MFLLVFDNDKNDFGYEEVEKHSIDVALRKN